MKHAHRLVVFASTCAVLALIQMNPAASTAGTAQGPPGAAELVEGQRLVEGDFVVPDAVTLVFLEGCGAGGGGGASAENSGSPVGLSGGGGGAGAPLVQAFRSVRPGEIVRVAIGEGGRGGASVSVAGLKGGQTEFGDIVFPGAPGGEAAQYAAGGEGGASIADRGVYGKNGEKGVSRTVNSNQGGGPGGRGGAALGPGGEGGVGIRNEHVNGWDALDSTCAGGGGGASGPYMPAGRGGKGGSGRLTVYYVSPRPLRALLGTISALEARVKALEKTIQGRSGGRRR